MNREELRNVVFELIGDGDMPAALRLLKEHTKSDPEIYPQVILLSGQLNQIEKNDDKITHEQHTKELNSVRDRLVKLVDPEGFFSSTFIQRTQTDDGVSVFFSLGTPINDKQEAVRDKLLKYFDSMDVNLVTLKDWDNEDPCGPIIKAMESCSGCLVLALEKIYLETGRYKGDKPMQDSAMPSSWLHIEAAIARSMNRPLLILKDESLIDDGLIDEAIDRLNVYPINQDQPEEFDQKRLLGVLGMWIKSVKAFRTSM